jgi:hypothetical protein
VYAIVAAPCPLVTPRLIQESWADADHAHSRAVSMTTLPVPPEAGNSGGRLLSDTAHLMAVGPLMLVVADPPHPAMTATSITGRRGRSDPARQSHMAFVVGVEAAVRSASRGT